MKMTDKIIMATVVVLSGLAVNSLRGQSASSWKIPQWQFDGTNYTWRPIGTDEALQSAVTVADEYVKRTDGVATNLTFYELANRAESWTRSDATNREWRSIAMSSDGKYQLAGERNLTPSSNTLQRSTDYGATWLPVSPSYTQSWLAAAVSSNGRYQSASGAGGIWYSTDYGATWTQSDADNKQWRGIAMSSSGEIQFAVASSTATNNGIWRSSDYGETWTRSSADNRFWQAIAVSSSDQYVTAVVFDGSTSNGIWYSTDYGFTFSRSDAENRFWVSVAMSSDGQYQSAVIESGSPDNGIWRSADYGATWTRSSAENKSWRGIAMTSDGQFQTATASEDGIWYSTDYGANWTQSDAEHKSWRGIAMASNGRYQSAVSAATATNNGIWRSVATDTLIEYLTEADADALYLSITNNFLPASTLTNLLDTKVSTNDTRYLDWTGADIRIADSLHIDSPTTRKDLFDAIQEFAQVVLYGTTNAHPVLAGYGTLVDLDDMPSQQTVDVALPGNTYVEVGRFAYTNATDFIRASKSFGSFWMSKATPNRSVSAQMSTAYTNVVTGANGIFDTSAFEPIPDTFLNSYRLSISPTFSVDDPETNTYYTVIFGMTNNVSQATTVTLYLGDPYDTHIEFGGLGKPEGFVTQADLDAADAAIYATVATNYVKLTDGVATNLTVDGTLTIDGDVTASGTVETDTGYLFEGVNALRLYKGSLAFYGSVAVGQQAGDATTGSGANNQTAMGYLAGRENTGANQTAVGREAGRQNSGADQTAMGLGAGQQNSGANQTATGYWAGRLNSGIRQTAMGYLAGYLNTGTQQTAMGYEAGRENSGIRQTAMGYWAGRQNSANRQTAMGYEAGRLNSGANQTALGYQAGRFIADGATANTNSANATYLGANTRSLTANDDNIIVIGTGAIGKGSGTAVWGQSAIVENYFSGAINFTQVPATPSTVANSGWIYAKTNEVYVLDGTGNETLIGPHAGTDQWSFISRNRYTGREISVDMEGMIRALERVSGEKLMQVSWHEPTQVWGEDEAAKVARRDADIAAWDAEAERRQFAEPIEGEPELEPMGERPEPYTPKPVPQWITERLKQRPGARQ